MIPYQDSRIIQHIYYTCDEFPDVKFKTPRDARLAQLAKELQGQTTQSDGSYTTNISDCLFNISKVNSGEAKPVYQVTDEWLRCMRDDDNHQIYNNEDLILR